MFDLFVKRSLVLEALLHLGKGHSSSSLTNKSMEMVLSSMAQLLQMSRLVRLQQDIR